MLRLGRSLLGLGVLFIAAPAYPADLTAESLMALPTLELRVNPVASAMSVGDEVTLVADPEASTKLGGSSAKVEFPAWDREQGLRLVLIIEDRLPEVRMGLLTPGSLRIPPLVVRDTSGQAIARTLPINLSVASSIAQDDPGAKQPDPPRGPKHLKFPWILTLFLVALAVLILGLILMALMRWSRKRRKKPVPVATTPVIPEDTWALEALTKLEREQLPKLAGDAARKPLAFKPLYFGVSDVLKGYLGRRYGFDARESTTRELLSALKDQKLLKIDLPDEVLREIRELFERLDLVKFTDHLPNSQDPIQVLAAARQIIERTRKKGVVNATA